MRLENNLPQRWLKPSEVRARYGIKYAQLLSIQLARWCGEYPIVKGRAGRKTLKMKLTKGLDSYLARLNRKKKSCSLSGA